MKDYFLDTSFLIDLIRGHAKAIKIYNEINSNWSASTISIYELAKFGKKDYKKLFREKNILNFTLDDAKVSSKIYKELQKKGKLINELDFLIAGTAKNRNLTLVTRDSHFKSVSGLKLKFYKI